MLLNYTYVHLEYKSLMHSDVKSLHLDYRSNVEGERDRGGGGGGGFETERDREKRERGRERDRERASALH